MHIFNEEISSTNTRAIQCEVLTRNSLSAHSMQFITPSRLQKAVENARGDLDYILSQSLHKNYLSETSKHPTKKNFEDTLCILNSSSSKTGNAIQTNDLVRRQDQNCTSEEIKFHGERRGIQSKVPQQRILISENSHKEEDILPKKEHLNEEELKWLGKNYTINHEGKAVVQNAESKLHHCETKFSRFTPQLVRRSEENQSSIHKTATDLINRVQMREQQLWRQLAEMSFNSIPSCSSYVGNDSSLRNYQPSLSNFSEEKIAVEEVLDVHICTEILPLISSNHRIPISETKIVSLLGEEWLDNLLRNELGILD